MNYIVIGLWMLQTGGSILMLWNLRNTYAAQHADIKRYVDAKAKSIDARLSEDLRHLESASKKHIDELEQSFEGIQNVTIKALEERVNKLETKAEAKKKKDNDNEVLS